MPRSEIPDSLVRCVGSAFPVLPIESNSLQGILIDSFETPCVNHIVCGIRPRAIERRYAADAAEVMKRPSGTELVGHKGVLSPEETESI